MRSELARRRTPVANRLRSGRRDTMGAGSAAGANRVLPERSDCSGRMPYVRLLICSKRLASLIARIVDPARYQRINERDRRVNARERGLFM